MHNFFGVSIQPGQLCHLSTTTTMILTDQFESEKFMTNYLNIIHSTKEQNVHLTYWQHHSEIGKSSPSR
jgi:hypothetical protein